MLRIMDDKKTHELDNIVNFIDSEKELHEYLSQTISNNSNIDFVQYLDKLRKDKNISKAELINNADISRTYGYQILNGSKYASRDKILKLCLSGKFNIEETNRLLTLGGYSRLYSKDPRDTVIIFAINKGLSVIDTDLFLDKFNQLPLDECELLKNSYLE